MHTYIDKIGSRAIKFFHETGQVIFLLKQIIQWIFKRPFEYKNIISQMVIIGVESLPVVILTSIATGMVLALQSGFTLEKKMGGSSLFVGAIVAISFTRELGPVLTSIVVAGRVGSAIAAEIGTMKVTEQIDALETMAINPVKYLAVPRFLACAIMLPILAIIADLIGVLGGAVISVTQLNITSATYFDSVRAYLSVGDVSNGLFKTVVFGMIIAIIGCHKGFITSGGAEGVGKATTSSVVLASILILIFDYFLTAILF